MFVPSAFVAWLPYGRTLSLYPIRFSTDVVFVLEHAQKCNQGFLHPLFHEVRHGLIPGGIEYNLLVIEIITFRFWVHDVINFGVIG